MKVNLNPIPYSAPATQPSAPHGDGTELLQALTRAGRVEAEVLQRLPGELLLDTRFGRFRIDSRLDFGPGDKLSLRVETQGSTPVLRVARVPAEPLQVPLARVPNLARLVTGANLVLAELRSSSGGQSELRTGDRLLRLPLELPPGRDQLWLLRRKPDGSAIEIEAVSRREVLRATLLQLLPRDRADAEPALPRLLQWAASLVGAGRPATQVSRLATGQAPAATSTPPGSSRAAVAGTDIEAGAQQSSSYLRRRGAARNAPVTAQRQRSGSVRIEPTPAQVERGAALSAARTAAVAVSNSVVRAVTNRPDPPTPAPSTAGTLPGRDNGASTSFRTASPTHGNNPVPPGAGALRAVPAATGDSAVTSTGHELVAANPKTRGPASAPDFLAAAARSGQTRGPFPAGVTDARMSAAHAPTGQPRAYSADPVALPPHPQSAASSAPSRSLSMVVQKWLGELPRLDDIEAGVLRRWLASAVRPRLTATFSAPAAVSTLAALRQSIYREISLQAEFADANRANYRIAAPAQADTASGDDMNPENRLPGWLRDGARLIEQAIGQSLLQRVSTALQADTQQPLTLSLAMPFLDAAEARPLILEIEQQTPQAEDAESSWEFRLHFELDGLGPISCQLRLQGQRLGASFFCAWPATHASIESALPELRRQLDRAGFTTDELASYAAAPPARKPAEPWRLLESLIDLRA